MINRQRPQKYRKIDPRIWNDEKFRGLSDDGQLAFLFILTHPHMTSLGAMRASIPGLAAEKGWPEKRLRKALGQAFGKGLLKGDDRASFLWAPNFLKYNGPESPNVVVSWGKSLDLIPECELKNELIQGVKGFLEGFSKAYAEALPEGFAKALGNQEQEQEQDLPPTPQGGEPSQGEYPSLPDIIEVYHEVLPGLPRVNEPRSDALKKKYAARCREYRPDTEGLDWWKEYFRLVADSDFLLGRKKDFTANFMWLLGPESMAKVRNGSYTNSSGGQAPPSHQDIQAAVERYQALLAEGTPEPHAKSRVRGEYGAEVLAAALEVISHDE